MSKYYPFILVVGPTGAGKSALGLRLAEKYKAAILNCDSLQAYRRLDIGTAKPSLQERARVPHFLFDVLEPGAEFTAGDFRRMALEVLERELRSAPVIGVGGSGFYIQALEKGMYDVVKPDPEIEKKLRAELASEGLPSMYSRLQNLDPVHAEVLSPNDSYRILRALVIIQDSGKKVSELRAGMPVIEFPYPLFKLGLAPSREWLLPRIVQRTQEMLRRGMLDEVRALRAEGFGTWPALKSIGYRECGIFLDGSLAEIQLAPLIVEKTMQLAKKQKTWFKRDQRIRWLGVDNPESEACAFLTDTAKISIIAER